MRRARSAFISSVIASILLLPGGMPAATAANNPSACTGTTASSLHSCEIVYQRGVLILRVVSPEPAGVVPVYNYNDPPLFCLGGRPPWCFYAPRSVSVQPGFTWGLIERLDPNGYWQPLISCGALHGCATVRREMKLTPGERLRCTFGMTLTSSYVPNTLKYNCASKPVPGLGDLVPQ